MRFRLLLPVLALLLPLASCPRERNIGTFKGDDAVMLDRVRDIGVALNQYHSDNAEWPQTLAEVAGSFPPGVSWPLNPYTNTPIADTGSLAFDPAKSPGMLCYEKILRDEQIESFALHVFGQRGELVTLYSRDFLPRQP